MTDPTETDAAEAEETTEVADPEQTDAPDDAPAEAAAETEPAE